MLGDVDSLGLESLLVIIKPHRSSFLVALRTEYLDEQHLSSADIYWYRRPHRRR